MGWSTDLFCNLTYNRQTFNSLSDVEDKIAELTKMIKFNEGVLKELAVITEPKKLFHLEEGEDPIDKIRRMVMDSLEELEEDYIERWKLEILKDNWRNCHNEDGLAINPPENISWGTAFLDGDFIRTVENPDSDNI